MDPTTIETRGRLGATHTAARDLDRCGGPVISAPTRLLPVLVTPAAGAVAALLPIALRLTGAILLARLTPRALIPLSLSRTAVAIVLILLVLVLPLATLATLLPALALTALLSALALIALLAASTLIARLAASTLIARFVCHRRSLCQG